MALWLHPDTLLSSMDSAPDTVSIVIAAQHIPGEALSLHAFGTSIRTLKSAMLTANRECEVVVVVDDPAGEPAFCAVANGARVVHDPFAERIDALRTGAAASRGELVVVVLDTVIPSPEKLQRAVEMVTTDETDLVVSARWTLYRRPPFPVFVTMHRDTADHIGLYQAGSPFVSTLMSRAAEASLRVKAVRIG
jgi:hypothetical protein